MYVRYHGVTPKSCPPVIRQWTHIGNVTLIWGNIYIVLESWVVGLPLLSSGACCAMRSSFIHSNKPPWKGVLNYVCLLCAWTHFHMNLYWRLALYKAITKQIAEMGTTESTLTKEEQEREDDRRRESEYAASQAQWERERREEREAEERKKAEERAYWASVEESRRAAWNAEQQKERDYWNNRW